MEIKGNYCVLLKRSMFGCIFDINKNFVYSSRLGSRFRLNAFYSGDDVSSGTPELEMIMALQRTIESSKDLFDCKLVDGEDNQFLATSSDNLYRYLFVVLKISKWLLEPENNSDVPRQGIKFTVVSGDFKRDLPEIKGFIVKSFIFPVPDPLDFMSKFPLLPQIVILEFDSLKSDKNMLVSINPIWTLKTWSRILNNPSAPPENLINFEFPDGMSEKEFLKTSSKNLIRVLYVVLKIETCNLPVTNKSKIKPQGVRLTVTDGIFRSSSIEVGYLIKTIDLPTSFIGEFPPLPFLKLL
jgi:hypothetical protein